MDIDRGEDIMLIILKFLIKNILEKKSRTMLVILSIAISTALSLATLVMSSNIQTMYSNQITKSFGEADLMITKADNSENMFFDPDLIYDFSDRLDYSVEEIIGEGIYNVDNNFIRMDLIGTDLAGILKMIDIVFDQGKNIEPFQGKKIIISKTAAERYDLSLGNEIEIEIANMKYDFQIVGLAQPDGIFMEMGQEMTAIVPEQILADIYGTSGDVNIMYMKTKEQTDKPKLVEELRDAFKDCLIDETITENEMKSYIDRMSTSFKLMVVAVFFICIFIIYSSFKVISIERLPLIGTFRSVGATKGSTNLIICLESLLYGVIGGGFGCLFGIFVSRSMTEYTTPEWLASSGNEFHIDVAYLLFTFLLALLISFVSSILPIIRVSSYPLKNIILNNIDDCKRSNKWKLIVGILCLIISIGIPRAASGQYALLFYVLAAVSGIISIILLIPVILNLFVFILDKVNGLISAGTSAIAVKNLRDNKSVINSISLLAIGIAVLILIDSFGNGLIVRITDYYTEQTYDLQMVADQADEEAVGSISEVYGVDGYYGIYEAENIGAKGKDEKVRLAMGVRKEFFDYYAYDVEWEKNTGYEAFSSGRNIVLSNTLSRSMKVDLGDSITLEMKKGDMKYKVIGIVDALQGFALIPEKYLKSDMELSDYSRILIKSSGDSEIAAQNIRDEYKDLKPQVETIGYLKESDLNANMQLILAMKAFSVMILFIGIIGVINNFIVSFMERRRALAVFRSIGMDKIQVTGMVLIESILVGILSGIVGILGGILLLSILPGLSESIGLKINVEYRLEGYLIYFVASILISVIASISPTLKSSKLNIIQSIKYD